MCIVDCKIKSQKMKNELTEKQILHVQQNTLIPRVDKKLPHTIHVYNFDITKKNDAMFINFLTPHSRNTDEHYTFISQWWQDPLPPCSRREFQFSLLQPS